MDYLTLIASKYQHKEQAMVEMDKALTQMTLILAHIYQVEYFLSYLSPSLGSIWAELAIFSADPVGPNRNSTFYPK